MPGASIRSRSRGMRQATPQQIAVYTFDMLMQLKSLAEHGKQARLAALIKAAADEAHAVIHAGKNDGK
jgi:formiminotetrahydrofolate cyclodeaminase